MNTTVTHDAPAVDRADPNLGIVDCDIHPRWSSNWSEFLPYMPKRWQDYLQTMGTRVFAGGAYPRVWHDPVDYAPPGGGAPGSDVGFMGVDHLDQHGIAVGVLIPINPATTGMTNLAFGAAFATAVNDLLAVEWLDVEPRLRGTIAVATEDAVSAADEIRRRASDRRFVQVGFSGRPREPMGQRRYWPIYEACAECDLPVMSHAFGSAGQPITGAGWPSFYLEEHVGPPIAIQANIASMILEGVFERFPKLKLVSVENGFGWVPQLAWRMDNAWEALRHEVPYLERRPSEYMAEHVYFATQPIEEPSKPGFFQHLLDQYPAFRERLVFSSDYPHWDGDTPARAIPELRDREIRDRVMRLNARQLYSLQ